MDLFSYGVFPDRNRRINIISSYLTTTPCMCVKEMKVKIHAFVLLFIVNLSHLF